MIDDKLFVLRSEISFQTDEVDKIKGSHRLPSLLTPALSSIGTLLRGIFWAGEGEISL
jgi:hypothetical protein